MEILYFLRQPKKKAKRFNQTTRNYSFRPKKIIRFINSAKTIQRLSKCTILTSEKVKISTPTVANIWKNWCSNEENTLM